MELKVAYRSSPNIAWIKYWGKYDEQYILPINDSLGFTLNSTDVHTKTFITFSKEIAENVLILNQENHPISKRVAKILALIKEKAFETKYKNQISFEDWKLYKFEIKSVNSFPTASGMASSASGLACLAAALNGLFGNILAPNQLSQLARLGSGSASRSVHGGLVRWIGIKNEVLVEKEKKSEEELNKLSKQCISFSTIPASELKFIKVIALLAHKKQKQISSTSGMQQSVETSELIKQRNLIAKKRIELILSVLKEINTARQNKDIEKERKQFNLVAQTIIKDSNQFHGICLDTYPPIFYLNEFSKQIIYIVDHIFNQSQGFKVAYTFDAGPHAFLFVHESNYSHILRYFVELFQMEAESLNEGARLDYEKHKKEQNVSKFKKYQGNIIPANEIWLTDVGEGCQRLE